MNYDTTEPTAPTEWRPSAALAQAVTKALQSLAVQWPRAMALGMEATESGRAYMRDYASAMKGAALDAIPLAVQRWKDENSMPPRPADLGKLAREITREYFPTFSQMSPQAYAPPVMATDKDTARIDVLGDRAYARLGSWSLVGEVWALLVYTGTADDQRAAARNGNVPDDVFDEAVTQVIAGTRAPSPASRRHREAA